MIKSAAGSAISCFKAEPLSRCTPRLDSGGIIILPGTRSFHGEAKVWFPEPFPVASTFRLVRRPNNGI